MLQHAVAAVVVLSLAGCGESLPPPEDGCDEPAPLLGREERAAPGYIVVFHDHVPSAAVAGELARKYNFSTKFVYTSALKGFAADFSHQVLAALRCEPAVKYVEYDGSATLR